MTQPPLIVRCPQCKKSLKWDKNNAFRPFCSERCKLIDLGAWAADEYSIPDKSPYSESSSEEAD